MEWKNAVCHGPSYPIQKKACWNLSTRLFLYLVSREMEDSQMTACSICMNLSLPPTSDTVGAVDIQLTVTREVEGNCFTAVLSELRLLHLGFGAMVVHRLILSRWDS